MTILSKDILSSGVWMMMEECDASHVGAKSSTGVNWV